MAEAFSPESLGISLGTYALIFIGGLFKLYLKKKAKDKLHCLCIPAGSQKKQLIKKFRETPQFRNIHLWHIEADIKDGAATLSLEQKEELIRLKKDNPLQYNTKMMGYLKSEMDSNMNKLKISNKIVVVVVSSLEFAKYLKLKKVYSFCPDNKLQRKICSERDDNMYLAYIRSQFNRNVAQFGDSDDLFDVVSTTLKKFQKKNPKKS